MEENIPYILYKTSEFEKIENKEILNRFKCNNIMLKSKIEYYSGKKRYFFIKKYFNSKVLKAYNKLIPGAYKADLWRLCVLYINGGIYGDLTQKFLKEYDVNEKNADLILVKDRYDTGIYNSFIATKRKNGFLKYCINKIVNDILKERKGINPLDVTGPHALKRHYLNFFKKKNIKKGIYKIKGIDKKYYKINISLYHIDSGGYCKNQKGEIIIENKMKNHNDVLYKKNTFLPDFIYNLFGNKYSNHYDTLWKKNKIFNTD